MLFEYKKIVNFNVYDYKVYVTFTNNVYESAVKLNKSGKVTLREDQLPQHTDGGCHIWRNGVSTGYVLIHSDGDIATMAHESYHAIKRMLDYVGIDDEEATAYHLDHLMGEIYYFFVNIEQQIEKDKKASEKCKHQKA